MIASFEYTEHPHTPVDINAAHKESYKSFNEKSAFVLSKLVETMWTFYVFAGISALGFLSVIGILPPFVNQLTTWLSQEFLQLVYLPVITVKQGVQDARAELAAAQQFQFVEKSYDMIGQMQQHISALETKLDQQASAINVLVDMLRSSKNVEADS
jgi:hypothetical protein